MLAGASERPLNLMSATMSSFLPSLFCAIWAPFMSYWAHMRHHPLSYATTFVPLKRLKANCLNRASRTFLINLVNLAR